MTLTFAFSILFMSGLIAQRVENLIINPSFETYEKFFPQGWRVISKSPDVIKNGVVFSPVVNTQLSDDIFFKNGADGMSYVNLVYSEILEGNLKSKLSKGVRYRLEFYVNRLPIKSQLFFEPLTIKFSNFKAPAGLDSKSVSSFLSISGIDSLKLANRVWQKVFIEFTADGGEAYFQLGYFGNALLQYGLSEVLVHYCFDDFVLYPVTELDISYSVGEYLLDISNKDRIKLFLSSIDSIQCVLIESYSSKIGNERENFYLSKQRANYLQNYIKPLLPKNTKIETLWYGDRKSLHNDKSFQKSVLKIVPYKKNIPHNEDQELKDRLRSIQYQDQYFRVKIDSLIRLDNVDSSLLFTLNQELIKADSINFLALEQILGENLDYPGLSVVGKEDMNIAFFVIQHMLYAKRKSYEPLIFKAAQSCEFDFRLLPLYIDRNLLDEGNCQLYGTQCFFDNKTKKYISYCIQNEGEVNQRRKEFLLPPLEQYLSEVNRN